MSGIFSSRRTGTGAAIAAALLLALVVVEAAAAQAPGIDWQRSDWFPYSSPVTTSYQSQAASGQDWWNNHSNSYDASHALQGYIAAGYSAHVNYALQELPTGCYQDQLGPFNCDLFESEGNVNGTLTETMALIRPDGTSYEWYKTYAQGEFFRVIQTQDGGYLATGYTGSTRTLDGAKPLYYNPGQTAGQVTDSFSPGHGCTTGGDNVVHATMVRTDAQGNVKWQYLYGLEPYRIAANAPDPEDGYRPYGIGFGVVEAANGDFIMVGEVADPVNTFGCPSGQPNPLNSAFMIEVTPDGLWRSGRLLKPSVTVPSSARGIAMYQDPGGLFHYAISGVEYFQSTDPTAFDGSTGCGLFQKVFAQQIDNTPQRSVEWDVTDFNKSSSTFQSSNQNNFDVAIASYSTYSAVTQSYSSHNDVLLPAVVDCDGCLGTARNTGTGMVFRLDAAAGSLIGQGTMPKPLLGFDLRMRATPTPNGGFAAVSTLQAGDPSVHIPPTPCAGGYSTSVWNTDAYVARFDPSNKLLWDTSFPNAEPPQPTVYPSDWKFKECLFSISQGQDGGFVVSGTDSYNFDDDYMTKLKPESPLAGPSAPDLIIRDTVADSGLEPNPDNGPMWVSPDIWVRLFKDGLPDPQNPEYSPGGSNWVYTRITNLGTASKTATLKLYWAKASTGLSWPDQWIGPNGGGYFVGNTLFGNLIGTLSVTVPAGTSINFPMEWKTIPNPADFTSFGVDQSHFCLLARLETDQDPTFGMTYPETGSVNFNTRNNAKIAWKNVSVDTSVHKTRQFVSVRNVAPQAALIRLAFGVSETGAQSPGTFLDGGTIDILLGRDLFQRWVKGGRAGRGVKEMRGQRIRLADPNASIGNIQMAAGEMATISALIDPGSQPPASAEVHFDVLQYSTVRRREELVGGMRFALAPPALCGGDLKLPILSDTDHWQVTEIPAALTGVPATPYPPYTAPGSDFGSSVKTWITAVSGAGASGPGGFYTYEYQFCLCGGFSNPRLSLNLATDNEATVQLNGSNTIGTTPPDLTPTAIATGPAQANLFKAGNNVLTIRVRNRGVHGDPTQPTPTGLTANGSILATSGLCNVGAAAPDPE